MPTHAPRFAARATVPLQQHPLYGAACAQLGAGMRAFCLSDGAGGVRGWALVLVRRWPGLGAVAMLARGPVWHPALEDAAKPGALHALLDGLRGTFRVVMATPDPVAGQDVLAGAGWLSMVAGGSVARLALTADAASLRAGMHGKWRNRLVRAEGAGLQVEIGAMPDAPDHWLLRAEDGQARSRGYKRLPPAFALAWRRAGGPRGTLLATAHADGAPVAGMLFLRHAGMASYHIGWTSDAGRACDAHRLLLYRSALALARKGHGALELGTLDTVTTPGLARFKLGIGAVQVQLGDTRIRAPGSTLVARLAGDGPGRPPARDDAWRCGAPVPAQR